TRPRPEIPSFMTEILSMNGMVQRQASVLRKDGGRPPVRSGADLEKLERLEVDHAAADALGRVKQDVGLRGERIAQDADADAVDDQIGAAKVSEGDGELAGLDRRHVVVGVDRLAEDGGDFGSA